MATLTFVGGSGDGYIEAQAATWQDARAAAGGSPYPGAQILYVGYDQWGGWYLDRSLGMHDTAGIPDNAVIGPASLALTAQRGIMGDATHVTSTISTSCIAAAFALANWGAASLGAFPSTVVANTQYNAILTGLNVNRAGFTYIGLRSAADLNNVAPTGFHSWYSADATTAAYRPLLTVEYTLPIVGSLLSVQGFRGMV